MGFVGDHKWVLLFYLVIVILVYANKKHFTMQGRFVAMKRTKIGIGLMNALGKKHSSIFRLLGFIGIGVGFIGLISISVLLIKNLIELFFIPGTQSAVAPVIPGIAIPGSPITIPLLTGWIGLFLVILIHEFSHGVIARAHDLRVKSSGIFFLGPILGAFVEPDDKQLTKASDAAQYSVYAAGPVSNIILTAVLLLALTYILAPIAGAMGDPMGVPINNVVDQYPAQQAGLDAGMVITSVNGNPVSTYDAFATELDCVAPNQTVMIGTDEENFSVLTAANPQDEKKGYLGIFASQQPDIQLRSDAWYFSAAYAALSWIIELFLVTAILSFGIGLANLLPLGPVDGGRMAYTFLLTLFPSKKATNVWKHIGAGTLMVLLINLLWPIFRAIIA